MPLSHRCPIATVAFCCAQQPQAVSPSCPSKLRPAVPRVILRANLQPQRTPNLIDNSTFIKPQNDCGFVRHIDTRSWYVRLPLCQFILLLSSCAWQELTMLHRQNELEAPSLLSTPLSPIPTICGLLCFEGDTLEPQSAPGFDPSPHRTPDCFSQCRGNLRNRHYGSWRSASRTHLVVTIPMHGKMPNLFVNPNCLLRRPVVLTLRPM